MAGENKNLEILSKKEEEPFDYQTQSERDNHSEFQKVDDRDKQEITGELAEHYILHKQQ